MEPNPQPDSNPTAELHARLAPQLEQARETLGEVNNRVSTFIRQHPGACLLGALAAGYLLGKWASRR